jgi:hypothetical protein
MFRRLREIVERSEEAQVLVALLVGFVVGIVLLTVLAAAGFDVPFP